MTKSYFERAISVNTLSILVTAPVVCETFIDVSTRDSIACEAVWTLTAV